MRAAAIGWLDGPVRLIFLNRFFWPDHSATSQMLSDVAFALGSVARPVDRDVVVVTSRLNYEAPDARLPAREVLAGIRIVRVWTSRFGRDSLAGRIVDYATFYPAAALALARLAQRGDVVVIKTDPPLLSLLAHPVARLKGARVVNWLQDIYPEVADALGVMPTPLRPLGWALRALRNLSLRRAAANVVLGRRMSEKVASFGVQAGRIVEIPNWADGDLIRPVPHADNSLRRDWDLGDAFVLAYSGNLGRAHEVATMLDAMACLEQTLGPDRVVWLFVGGGAQLGKLRQETAARGLCSVRFQPYQPRERLAESLSVADAHLVSLRPSLEGLIVPSKLYGVLAAGRPAIFIGDEHGEVGRVLLHGECGATVAVGDGASLAALIADWERDRSKPTDMGRRARALFDATYDKRFAIARWERLVDRIARGDA